MPPLQPDKAKNSIRQPRLLLSEQRPLYGRDSSDQRTRALRSIYRQRETDTRQRRAQAHTRTPPLRSRNQNILQPRTKRTTFRKVTFKTDSKAVVTATTDPEKRYTLSDVFDGTRIRSVSLSPNGKYLLTAYQTTYPGGDTESFQQVTDRATGQV
mgnify:CR=1 FL=1